MGNDYNMSGSRLKGALSEKKYAGSPSDTNEGEADNIVFNYENTMFQQSPALATSEKKIMTENFSNRNISDSVPIFDEPVDNSSIGSMTSPVSGLNSGSMPGSRPNPMPGPNPGGMVSPMSGPMPGSRPNPMSGPNPGGMVSPMSGPMPGSRPNPMPGPTPGRMPMPESAPRTNMYGSGAGTMRKKDTYHSIPFEKKDTNASKIRNLNIYAGIVTSISAILLIMAVITVVWFGAIGSDINSGNFLDHLGKSLSQYSSFLSYCDVTMKLISLAYFMFIGNIVSIILASKYDRRKMGWGVFGVIASIIYIMAISGIGDAVSSALKAKDIVDSFFLNILNI